MKRPAFKLSRCDDGTKSRSSSALFRFGCIRGKVVDRLTLLSAKVSRAGGVSSCLLDGVCTLAVTSTSSPVRRGGKSSCRFVAAWACPEEVHIPPSWWLTTRTSLSLPCATWNEKQGRGGIGEEGQEICGEEGGRSVKQGRATLRA
eukprot:763857-Hanusia_phi.AAC.2